MNDYLWDKTGAPDDEVKRLEELLGTLRCPPRPLELPLETATSPLPAVAARRSTLLRPWFAVAATLILTVFAGVMMIVLRLSQSPANLPQIAQRPVAATANAEAGQAFEGPPAPPARAHNANESLGTNTETTSMNEPKDMVATPDKAELGRRASRRFALAAEPNRRRTRSDSLRGGAGRSAQVASDGKQLVSPRERIEAERAKGQLMLALHVASAKFNLAQRKAPGIAGVTADPVQ